MPTINSMPTELLFEVVSYLPCQGNSTTPYRDLAALSRVNRDLYDRLNHILYTSNKAKDNSNLVFWAAQHGRIETLERAIQFGLPLNPDGPQSTIGIATKNGDSTTVAWLVDHGVDMDKPGSGGASGSYSPLFLALRNKKTSVARLLIDKGASLMFSFKNENNPMRHKADSVSAVHVAAASGFISIVRYLVREKGVDINVFDDTGFTCLHYAALLPKRHRIQDLVALGADVNATNANTRYSPLSYALYERNFDATDALLDAGASANSLSPSPIDVLLGSYYPRYEGESRLLERLIELGADLNPRTVQGQTPLAKAITNKPEIEPMMILVRAGADVQARVQGLAAIGIAWKHFAGAWDQAARFGRHVVPPGAPGVLQAASKIAFLLSEGGARLDTPYSTGYSHKGYSLLHEAIRHEPISFPYERLDLLLGLAPKQAMKDGHINIALGYAAKHRRDSCCQVLLNHGAELTTSKGPDWAQQWVSSILDERSRKLGQPGTPSDLQIHNLEMAIKLRLSRPEWDGRKMYWYPKLPQQERSRLAQDDIYNLFTKALKNGDARAAHVFLDQGITQLHPNSDVTEVNPNVWLHEAVTSGRVDILRRLLTKGQCNVNGFDEQGWLPIARAVQAKHLDATMLLMEHGADVSLRNKAGNHNSAEEIAKSLSSDVIASCISRAKA
ncbi:hypothetical protein Hte_001280 [Hypoxylon texense]